MPIPAQKCVSLNSDCILCTPIVHGPFGAYPGALYRCRRTPLLAGFCIQSTLQTFCENLRDSAAVQAHLKFYTKASHLPDIAAVDLQAIERRTLVALALHTRLAALKHQVEHVRAKGDLPRLDVDVVRNPVRAVVGSVVEHHAVRARAAQVFSASGTLDSKNSLMQCAKKNKTSSVPAFKGSEREQHAAVKLVLDLDLQLTLEGARHHALDRLLARNPRLYNKAHKVLVLGLVRRPICSLALHAAVDGERALAGGGSTVLAAVRAEHGVLGVGV